MLQSAESKMPRAAKQSFKEWLSETDQSIYIKEKEKLSEIDLVLHFGEQNAIWGIAIAKKTEKNRYEHMLKQSFRQWHSDMEKKTIRWKYTFTK